MRDMTIYAVSSMRDYGDGEVYFSTDCLCTTIEEAQDYIRSDAEATREEHASVYDDDFWPEPKETDLADCVVEFDGHLFAWRIDTFKMQ